MPCFDKKLESSRKEFYNESFKAKDVDCVLSTLEIQNLLDKECVDLGSLDEDDLDRPYIFINIYFNKSNWFILMIYFNILDLS